uniref:Uncharacterized protein n=1 Tax=Chromera velia CCMP2878 TaxID=1169474 RepID=A0A0G4HGE4_9ALVE|eukprot:Cvel_6759.t1-p1 / transcript=Cvel_6759.t1 / gene=Cvel_6759 / organism=Chromera_velia_CCMP2878 / gene_product=hypothetical protein / transcript_product=hypothetical protein / location=Cvel_scaffold339:23699-35858(-) / protein_length=1296 / sequence_SO=supercontig / SO=protein_coding / is_pseudo=false
MAQGSASRRTAVSFSSSVPLPSSSIRSLSSFAVPLYRQPVSTDRLCAVPWMGKGSLVGVMHRAARYGPHDEETWKRLVARADCISCNFKPNHVVGVLSSLAMVGYRDQVFLGRLKDQVLPRILQEAELREVVQIACGLATLNSLDGPVRQIVQRRAKTDATKMEAVEVVRLCNALTRAGLFDGGLFGSLFRRLRDPVVLRELTPKGLSVILNAIAHANFRMHRGGKEKSDDISVDSRGGERELPSGGETGGEERGSREGTGPRDSPHSFASLSPPSDSFTLIRRDRSRGMHTPPSSPSSSSIPSRENVSVGDFDRKEEGEADFQEGSKRSTVTGETDEGEEGGGGADGEGLEEAPQTHTVQLDQTELRELVSALSAKTAEALCEMDLLSLTIALNAFARLGGCSADTLDLTMLEVVKHLPQASGRQLALLLNSATKISQSRTLDHPQFLPAILHSVRRVASSMDLHSVCLVANALARLRLRDIPLFDLLYEAAAVVIHNVSQGVDSARGAVVGLQGEGAGGVEPLQLAMLAHAWARAHVHNDDLFEILRVPISKVAGRMTGHELSLVVFAYCHFQKFDVAFFGPLVGRLHDMLKAGQLSGPDTVMLFNALARVGALYEPLRSALLGLPKSGLEREILPFLTPRTHAVYRITELELAQMRISGVPGPNIDEKASGAKQCWQEQRIVKLDADLPKVLSLLLASQSAQTSAVAASSAPPAALKPSNFSWVPKVKSLKATHLDNWMDDWKTQSSLFLSSQYHPDTNLLIEIYKCALLHAFSDFEELHKDVHTAAAQGHETNKLLNTIINHYLKDKSVEKTITEVNFHSLRREKEKGETLKEVLRRLDKVIRSSDAKGFTPMDKDMKKLCMKRLFLTHEWTDIAEKAAMELKKDIDSLTYSDIRSFTDHKADALAYKSALHGAESKGSKKELVSGHEFGGAAEKRDSGKKGTKKPKGKKKKQQVKPSKETTDKAEGTKCNNYSFVHCSPDYCLASKSECKTEWGGCGKTGHLAWYCPRKKNSPMGKKESRRPAERRSRSSPSSSRHSESESSCPDLVDSDLGSDYTDDELLPDTGCTFGLLNEEFAKYSVSQKKRRTEFNLATKSGAPMRLLSSLTTYTSSTSLFEMSSGRSQSWEPQGQPPESLPSSDRAVVSSDPVLDDVDVMPIDVDPIVEQIQEEVCRTDFLDWKSKGRKEKKAIIFQRKKERRAREEVRKAKALDRHFEVACMVLKAEKAKKLMKRENNAKGYIPAPPEEIAAGSHVEFDKKELERWALCGVFDLSSQTQYPRLGVKPITLRWVRT